MPSDPFAGSGGAAAKVALRDQLHTRRNRRSLAEVGECARELATLLLAAPEVRRAATVAAYVSIGNEPGTGLLLDGLEEQLIALVKVRYSLAYETARVDVQGWMAGKQF